MLLSDQVRRTQKYFHALAAQVPCVSFGWIAELCRGLGKQRRKDKGKQGGGGKGAADGESDREPLPTKKTHLLAPPAEEPVFRNKYILIVGDRPFTDTWSKTLGLAGARIIDKQGARTMWTTDSQSNCSCDYALIQEQHKMPGKADSYDVVHVTTDFIIACLNEGAILPNAKYF